MYHLSLDDLSDIPIWEYALDEEGMPGQDEATVKPRPDLSAVDPSEGSFVVHTMFESASGATFRGYSQPAASPDLGLIQPTIIAKGSHIHFWFGIIRPRGRHIERSYQLLEMSPDDLFPVRFESLVDINRTPGRRSYRGFLFPAFC